MAKLDSFVKALEKASNASGYESRKILKSAFDNYKVVGINPTNIAEKTANPMSKSTFGFTKATGANPFYGVPAGNGEYHVIPNLQRDIDASNMQIGHDIFSNNYVASTGVAHSGEYGVVSPAIMKLNGNSATLVKPGEIKFNNGGDFREAGSLTAQQQAAVDLRNRAMGNSSDPEKITREQYEKEKATIHTPSHSPTLDPTPSSSVGQRMRASFNSLKSESEVSNDPLGALGRKITTPDSAQTKMAEGAMTLNNRAAKEANAEAAKRAAIQARLEAAFRSDEPIHSRAEFSEYGSYTASGRARVILDNRKSKIPGNAQAEQTAGEYGANQSDLDSLNFSEDGTRLSTIHVPGQKGTIPVNAPGQKRTIPIQQQATQSPASFQESAKKMAENGSTSEKYLANKLINKRDNFAADLEEARKSGDDKKIAGVFEEHGIKGFDKSKSGKDMIGMVNNHFMNKLNEGPSFGDKMMAHHVPHIAFAGAAVGGSVLALSSSKGQKSNEELYGGV